MAKNVTCSSCGGLTPPGECIYCSTNNQKPNKVEMKVSVGGDNNKPPRTVVKEVSNGVFETLFILTLMFLVIAVVFLIFPPFSSIADETQVVVEPTESVEWMPPDGVDLFSPDYIMNNTSPSVFPNRVFCPSGYQAEQIEGAWVCDFSDTHTTSIVGTPINSSFPEGYAFGDGFVWAYNLPDVRATKIAQIPFGISFAWQGCYEMVIGNIDDDPEEEMLYWTFVEGYGWIDAYQVVGGCQLR